MDLLEYYAKCDEMEIKNFIYRQKQSEAYAKQQELYRIQAEREKEYYRKKSLNQKYSPKCHPLYMITLCLYKIKSKTNIMLSK